MTLTVSNYSYNAERASGDQATVTDPETDPRPDPETDLRLDPDSDPDPASNNRPKRPTTFNQISAPY